jgi:hypothetical protein
MRCMVVRYEDGGWYVWNGQWLGQTQGASQYETELKQFQRFLVSNLIFGTTVMEGRYEGKGHETLNAQGREFVAPRDAIPYPHLSSGLVSSVILLERVLPRSKTEWPRWRVTPVLSGANVAIDFFRPA